MDMENVLKAAARFMITEVAKRSGVDEEYALDQLSESVRQLINSGQKAITATNLINLTVSRILQQDNKQKGGH